MHILKNLKLDLDTKVKFSMQAFAVLCGIDLVLNEFCGGES